MSETHRRQKSEPCDLCSIEPGIKNLKNLFLCRKCFKKLKKKLRRQGLEDSIR